MEKGYLLGVDGGNTKTLYFLHDSDGRFVDYVAAGASEKSEKGSAGFTS